MPSSKLPIRYRKKPLFGFDIGNGSFKVVQLYKSDHKVILEGYGTELFNPAAVKDGEIIDFEELAKVAKNMFDKKIVGSITTSRIAASLPVSHSFSRIISLPKMDEKDVLEAIKLEAMQYIPVPLDQLYIDYQLIESFKDRRDYIFSAAPKKVVDSYIALFNILGLEVVAMEPSILSVTRLVKNSEETDMLTLVIDCGSTTTDLIIYNHQSVRLTGTIKFGGHTITNALMEMMDLTETQASTVKGRYGLEASKRQSEIMDALETPLKSLTNDIKKIIRYFEDLQKNEKVEQIIILGGGANLPGFSTYLTSALRIPTRLCGVWQNIGFDKLQPPNQLESSLYATAIGLALISLEDINK